MNHLKALSLSIGAMSDTKIVISCVNYNSEISSIADFQEQVVEQLVDYYHKRLLNNKTMIELLVKHEISIDEIVKLKLGFCDRTLNKIIPKFQTEEGANIRGMLEIHGLVRCSGHEEFRGCIVMPLYDENGLVSGIFGRRMTQYIRRNGRRHTLWLATQNAINKLNFPVQIKDLQNEY